MLQRLGPPLAGVTPSVIFGVKEMMRTGRIAMVRGARGHAAEELLENGHAADAVTTLN